MRFISYISFRSLSLSQKHGSKVRSHKVFFSHIASFINDIGRHVKKNLGLLYHVIFNDPYKQSKTIVSFEMTAIFRVRRFRSYESQHG